MIRVRSIAAQLTVLLLLVAGLVIADGDRAADAAFEVTCDEDGSTLVWPNIGADNDTFHIRRLNNDGSSTWVAKVRGAFFHELEENGPDDTWIVRFRLGGVVNDWECSEIARPPAAIPVTCWHYGGVLMWSTPDANIVDGDYIVRELRERGTAWVRTIDAAAPVDGPDVIQNVAVGFEADEIYYLRYWVAVDGVEEAVTARCWSWFAGQPVAPGAFVAPCIQTDRVVVTSKARVDRDTFHARTADGTRWITSFGANDVQRADGYTAMILPTSDEITLRWREAGVKVDASCDSRFPVID